MKTSDSKLLRLIALFRLLKAALLIAVGIGALKLVHSDVVSFVENWVARLGLDPGSRYVGRFLLKAAALTPNKIKELAAGSFIYASLFLTEGVGLWLVKRWAVWFSIIITTSLLPFEVHGIYRHPSSVKVLVLVVNIGVVAFLLHRIRTERTN